VAYTKGILKLCNHAQSYMMFRITNGVVFSILYVIFWCNDSNNDEKEDDELMYQC
jgi:hypothetical protein